MPERGVRASNEAERLAAAGRNGVLEHEKFRLRPYRHWTDGRVGLRGRPKVVAHLTGRPGWPLIFRQECPSL